MGGCLVDLEADPEPEPAPQAAASGSSGGGGAAQHPAAQHPAQQRQGRVYVPEFNTAVFFRVPRYHSVTPLTTTRPRCAGGGPFGGAAGPAAAVAISRRAACLGAAQRRGSLEGAHAVVAPALPLKADDGTAGRAAAGCPASRVGIAPEVAAHAPGSAGRYPTRRAASQLPRFDPASNPLCRPPPLPAGFRCLGGTCSPASSMSCSTARRKTSSSRLRTGGASAARRPRRQRHQPQQPPQKRQSLGATWRARWRPSAASWRSGCWPGRREGASRGGGSSGRRARGSPAS